MRPASISHRASTGRSSSRTPRSRTRSPTRTDRAIPGLTELGCQQATRTGRWLAGIEARSLWTSPMRLRAFLAGLAGDPGPVAAVTHGGVTTELLRDLLGDEALPPGLLDAGIPPCAVTAIDGASVVMIASTAHLS